MYFWNVGTDLFNIDLRNLEEKHLTFVSVSQQDSRHELLLAVRPEGIPDQDLLLRQLALQVQGVPPVELDFSCRTHKQEIIVFII